jgi:tetratricopeptide (TPR) repeat protein
VDQWVRRIDLQFDNLRAAFAWASKRDDHGEAALRLAGALRTYWSYQGHLSEGMGWLNVALARGGAAPAAARARALLAQASQTRHQGELARTHSTAEASLALFRQTDDRIGLAWCLVFLANNVNEPHSQAYADEALKLFRETGSMDGISRALRALGAGAHRTGNDALAIELLEQSVVASQAAGESWDINLCLIRLYDVDPQRALKLCARELAHRRAIGNLEHVAAMLLSYGILLVSHGEFAHAQTVLDEALRWWQQPDATPRYWAFPVILLGQGFIELSMGHLEPAISWFEQSRKLHYEMGAYAVSDVALLLIASVRIAQGDLATATDVTRTCLQRFHGYGYHTGMMCSVVQLAELAHKRGDHSRAVKLLAAADVLGHEYDVTLPWATRLCSAWYQHVQLTNAKLTLAAARNQLGGAEFDASYLAGAQMTLAQSVMYALQGE